MFGLFGINRQYRKMADRIGLEIHRQLRQALTDRQTIPWTPEQMTFTAGYLKAFTFVGFSELGCLDIDTHMKYIKHFCDGVLPGQLWEIVQRGEALRSLSQTGEREEFRRARAGSTLGEEAGISDAAAYFSNGIQPKGFGSFLAKSTI